MEIGLKERLIGAVVLVVLAIILIPFFLKGPSPDSTVTQPVNLPPGAATAAPPQEYSLPLTATPPAVTHAAAPAASAAPALAANPAPPKAAPRPVAPVPVAAAAKPGPAQPAAGKWAVQVGSFGSEGRATEVLHKLSSRGLHAYISRFQKGGQTFYRVRVGPYAERSQAEHAVAGVAKAYGGKAEVVSNS